MEALFLGGDLRQKYACELLIKNNVDAEYYPDFHIDNKFENKIKRPAAGQSAVIYDGEICLGGGIIK